jgi:hypothetical protein
VTARPAQPTPDSSITRNSEQISLPENLHHAEEDQLDRLEPGDTILLDQAPTLRGQAGLAFHAVIACPACGASGLITRQQYFGSVPVICRSDSCACRFRIQEQSAIIYLPVN